MTAYFVRRLLWAVPVLIGVATLVFLLIHLVPGDPDAPHLTVFPGLAVGVLVLGFNFLGDALRDQLDPRGGRL